MGETNPPKKDSNSNNKNPDPVISLNRQFNKIMSNYPTPVIKDEPIGGWVQLGQLDPNLSNRKYNLIKKNKNGKRISRYDSGDRIYQMQVDYAYYIRDVQDTEGKNGSMIRQCQEFINSCKEELGLN